MSFVSSVILLLLHTATFSELCSALAFSPTHNSTALYRRVSNSELFPISTIVKSWSTWTSSQSPTIREPLNDSTFRPKNEITALPHPYVNAPDGKLSMKAHFPKGSYTFTHEPQGGFSFYAPGPAAVDLTTAKEATFGYSVYFQSGYQWNKGGKLPGLYGGDSESVAVSCSGGSRRQDCFSARLMWRAAAAGELYTYLPSDLPENTQMCNLPGSECNPTYGASVGRGSYVFKAGGWTTVSQRVRLNDIGQKNGELQLWANGKSVVSLTGLTLRTSSSGRIRGMQFQTFFGGSTADYASPQDQDVYFSDFSVAITKTL